MSGVTARTIRLYLERGLLPRPPFLGSATRYQRDHLVALTAIRHLRAIEQLDLSEIRARIQRLSKSELESLVSQQELSGPVASALGLTVANSTLATSPETGRALFGDAIARRLEMADNGLAQSPRWHRAELALGLELHLRDDASREVVELARKVRELCAPSPAGSRTS